MKKHINNFLYFRIYKGFPLLGFFLLRFLLFVFMLSAIFIKRIIIPVVALYIVLFTVVFANELRDDFKTWIYMSVAGLILAIFTDALCSVLSNKFKEMIEEIELHEKAYLFDLHCQSPDIYPKTYKF